MPDKIKIIVKPVGLPPHIEYCDNALRDFQKIVGGYIETVSLATDLAVVCNEEGRLMNLPENCRLAGVDFVGDIFLVDVDGEDFTDCPMKLADANKIF